jgi:DNA polymerase
MNKKLKEFYKSRYNLIKDKLDFSKIDITLVEDEFVMLKGDNPIMVIGEAPGGTEVELGKPFCGPAGKNLDYLISISGLTKEKDILITNALPFRTFENTEKGVKNRTPSKEELKVGSELLIEELKIVKPRIILLLGGSAKSAVKFIPELKEQMKTLQRDEYREIELYGFKTILTTTYHPSPLVYNTKAKAEILQNYFKNILSKIYK